MVELLLGCPDDVIGNNGESGYAAMDADFLLL
jgi:hypothetical protein